MHPLQDEVISANGLWRARQGDETTCLIDGRLSAGSGKGCSSQAAIELIVEEAIEVCFPRAACQRCLGVACATRCPRAAADGDAQAAKPPDDHRRLIVD